MVQGEKFTIENMWYVPMGNHTPMLNRPYMIHADHQAISTISDRLAQSKSGKITTGVMSGLSGNLVQPSTVGFNGLVNSDWVSNRRFIFVFKIRSTTAFGEEANTYIQGYTDYDGITQNGTIDYNMRHYINSVSETALIVTNTPLGQFVNERLVNIYNILPTNTGNDYFTQRPSDVLDGLNTLEMSKMLTIDPSDAFSSMSYVSAFNNTPSCSAVTNSIASDYMAKILNTGLMASKERELHYGSFDGSISSETSAERFLTDPNISGNRFIKYLNAIAGNRHVGNSFTFSSIAAIDPTTESRFILLNNNKSVINPYLSATPEVGDHWLGQDPVTVKAYSLIESSVALATKHGFSKLYFSVSNMQCPTGTPEVIVTYFNSFMGVSEQDFVYLLDLFKERFILEVFNNETRGNTVPLHMDMFVDLVGTSKVNLSYGGFNANWYTAPSAANSLFSPVMTVDKNGLDYMSATTGALIDSITETTSSIQQSFY